LHQTARRFRQAFLFKGSDNGQNILRFYFCDGNFTESWKQIGVEAEYDMPSVFLRGVEGLVFIPFHSDILERIGFIRKSGGAEILFVQSWVNVIGKQFLDLVAHLSR
jgi:hypothetical protein